jgi:hypothetical protein
MQCRCWVGTLVFKGHGTDSAVQRSAALGELEFQMRYQTLRIVH